MTLLSFTPKDVETVSDALYIAEDVTANFFKFSTLQWKRQRYEVRIGAGMDLSDTELDVFAYLRKGNLTGRNRSISERLRDYYLICLQDHKILKAAQQDENVSLLPLLLYVFTHELIHIVRFCSFYQDFEARPSEREKEERLVHELTYRALANISLPNLGYVLESYKGHRMCGFDPEYLI